MRVLVIEDEPRLAATLADIITENNDIADVSFDGESGLDGALTGIYDAIILDIMLPKLNGMEVLLKLRHAGITTPVLILTAKSELEDKVYGLDSGADYYLTKPFEAKELLASLRAIARRGESLKPDTLQIGNVALDIAMSQLNCNGRSVRLSAKELELMRLLIANQNMFLPKELIFLKVWGYDTEAEESTVEVYISFLRRKLEHIHANTRIVVQRRIGYKCEVDQ